MSAHSPPLPLGDVTREMVAKLEVLPAITVNPIHSQSWIQSARNHPHPPSAPSPPGRGDIMKIPAAQNHYFFREFSGIKCSREIPKKSAILRRRYLRKKPVTSHREYPPAFHRYTNPPHDNRRTSLSAAFDRRWRTYCALLISQSCFESSAPGPSLCRILCS